MKAAVKKKWTDLKSSGNPEQNAVDEEIFEGNYTDRIIYTSRSLDAVYKYIRDNPHRLAIRKLHPEFFCRIRKLKSPSHKILALQGRIFWRDFIPADEGA